MSHPIGRWSRALPALVAVAALSLSCASSEQLTRRSERQLVKGDARKAYDTALQALERDPRNEQARGAVTAAGGALLADARTRFYDAVPVDTLVGAHIALDVAALRATLQRVNAGGAIDSAFARDLVRARWGAANLLMGSAADSLALHRPRAAFRLLDQAAQFTPERRDLNARRSHAFDLSAERVAVLPFDDQIGQPELPRALADQLAAAFHQRDARHPLEFTRLVDPTRVYERMSVAQLGDLSRDDAIRLGRDVGADVVVWGRLYDAGTDNNTTYYREPLWHHEVVRGAGGTTEDHWVQVPFETVVRERVYHLRWDLQAIDVDDEATLGRRTTQREVRARTVWTSFRPEDDPTNYALVAPDVRAAEPERAKQADAAWSAAAGQWTVPKLLERSRASNASSRAAYRHEYRGEFEHGDPQHPVFLGALPTVDDMAWLAVRDLDGDFLELVEQLDTR